MKDIEKIMNNLEEIMKILEVYKYIDIHIPVVNDMHIPAPQEELEDKPNIRYFNITDLSNILENGMGNKYPLFVKDENNSHHLIINYDIMKEFLYRDDVEIRLSFGLKDSGTGACAVFKPSEVTVHVGTTTITGEKEDGTIVEIRAKNWKDLYFARVTVRKISKEKQTKKMKRFFGMMPVNEIERTEHFVDENGLSVRIDAGPNGWTVRFADMSSKYKDESIGTEANFKNAYEVAVECVGHLTPTSEEDKFDDAGEESEDSET